MAGATDQCVMSAYIVPSTAGVIHRRNELVRLRLVLAGKGLEAQRAGIADPVEVRPGAKAIDITARENEIELTSNS